ncbi:MAG: hypothetical protein KFH87_13945 [Bacteroidetes bacterium]|nr:hypothetical protein [Bacteroidota bacterium]
MHVTAKLILPLLLIAYLTACSEDDPISPKQDHVEAIGMALFQDGQMVASILRGVPSDTLVVVEGALTEDYEVRFYDENEELFEIHDDNHEHEEESSFAWALEDPTVVAVLQDEGHEGTFEFRLQGLTSGGTHIEFFIMHGDHADFRSGKWPVRVR